MKTQHTLFASLLFLLYASTAFAQEVASITEVSERPQRTIKDLNMNVQPPSFIGGNKALTNYMHTNLNYPESAKKQGIEGTVILSYYIKKDGTIENISVIQSVSPELDQEAIRLAANMPEWQPAIQNDIPRRVKYQLPIKFELNF